MTRLPALLVLLLLGAVLAYGTSIALLSAPAAAGSSARASGGSAAPLTHLLARSWTTVKLMFR